MGEVGGGGGGLKERRVLGREGVVTRIRGRLEDEKGER